MAHFCEHCGTRLSDGAQFCPECGARIAQTQPQQPQQQNYQQQPYQQVAYQKPSPTAPAEKKSQSTPKRSKGFMIAVIALAVVMAIEGVIAGVWYPGFFTGGSGSQNPSDSKSDTDGRPKLSINNGDDWAELIASAQGSPTTTDQLSMRYTEEQLAQAEESSAPVSAEENTAEAGDVSVHFGEGAVSEDCDLTVKDLPVLTEQGEDEVGYSIKGYEINLSSGQDHFDTEVEVNIPRTTSDNEIGSCVWYNEEEDKWENIYSEVSEDGKYYRVYITHFTDIAELTYSYDPSSQTITSANDRVYDLKSGIFREVDRAVDDDLSADEAAALRMMYPVKIDYDRMWALANTKERQAVDDIGAMMDNVISWDRNGRALKQLDSENEVVNTAYGYGSTVGGSTWNIFEIGRMTDKLEKTFKWYKPLGKAFAVMDVVLTSLKVTKETLTGDRSYKKNFLESCKNNELALWSAGLSAAGLAVTAAGITLSAPIACVMAVAATTVFCMQLVEMDAKEKQDDGLPIGRGNPVPETEEDFYLSYLRSSEGYFEGTYAAENNYNPYRFVIRKPSHMTDEQFEAFKKFYESNPGSIMDGYDTVKLDKANAGSCWNRVFLALIQSCDDPEYFELIYDELIENFASGYWNLSEAMMDEYLETKISALKESGLYKEGVDPKPLKISREDQRVFTNRVKEKLKAAYFPLLKNAAATAQHMAYTQFMDEAQKLEQYLNTPMYFYFEDGSVDDVKKSAYYIDWRYIEYNEKHSVTQGGEYYADVRAPMKFKDAEPHFYPLPADSNLDLYSVDKYYPYTSNYIPNVNGEDNCIFKCTLYKYLMMGAPTEMNFYDPATLEDETPEYQSVDMTFPSEITPGQTIKVTVAIGGDAPADIAPLIGDWALDGSEKHETYKISEEELVLPDGEKRTIAMCTQKDDIYTLKLTYTEDDREKTQFLSMKLLEDNRLQLYDDGKPGDELTRIEEFLGLWDTNNSRNNTWEIQVEGDKMTLIIGGYSKENEAISFDCTYLFEDGAMLIYSQAFPKGYAELTPQKNGSIAVKVYGNAAESFTLTRMD